MKRFELSTKKGAASLYVVVFATILFGVITLSFIRIIISESQQSSNDDLSQSAYDAAMAGVEDSKIAVNKFYQCVNRTRSDCGEFGGVGTDADPNKLFGGECDGGNFKLKKILYGEDMTDTEVKIQESTMNNTDQAYTCVILSNVVGDYRSTLTSDTRTRVVPIGVRSNKLGNVKYIDFSWYSEVNGVDLSLNRDGRMHNKSETTTPPVVSLSLLKTGPDFSVAEFNNSTDYNTSTVVLLPSEVENAKNELSQSELNAAANSNNGGDNFVVPNSPVAVKCGTGSEFACRMTLGVSGDTLQLANGGNAMLVVSLPYGDTVTDFAVTLRDGNGDAIDFENVQVKVDSTGRSNQLLRRVESRLDPADVFFPYPQYEVELDGNGENPLLKNFWITANCWTEKGNCENNGTVNATN